MECAARVQIVVEHKGAGFRIAGFLASQNGSCPAFRADRSQAFAVEQRVHLFSDRLVFCKRTEVLAREVFQ